MSAGKEEIKANENIDVNELKNTTKFNKDNNNFNGRTNRDYNNTLIAANFIEAEKQVIGSFQSQVDRNSGGIWDLYNPQRIAQNYSVAVNNFTSYLLNTSNNALASNMRVYNTALEQTRDNLKAFAKTNTNYIKSVEQSVNSQNRVRWIDTLKFSHNGHYSKRFKELELAIHTLSNNNQSLGISYIANKENHNKKFMVSIIKFLKEIGWLVQDEDRKNIIVTKQT